MSFDWLNSLFFTVVPLHAAAAAAAAVGGSNGGVRRGGEGVEGGGGTGAGASAVGEGKAGAFPRGRSEGECDKENRSEEPFFRPALWPVGWRAVWLLRGQYILLQHLGHGVGTGRRCRFPSPLW